MNFLEIDGSQGEGGGQILRSSLSLSAVTKTPLKLRNIRAGRSKPGLLRQHLTAVNAMQEICTAEINGAHLGSQELEFVPKRPKPGSYAFRIGTAGSTTLVAQTILPALLHCDEPSEVTFEGGTHNPAAPPFDFFESAFLRQLNRMGPIVEARLSKYGFFPAGGGKFSITVQPSKALKGLHIASDVQSFSPKVTAVVAGIPRNVAERECSTIRRKANWREDSFQVIEVRESVGAGNVVLIELQGDETTEVFAGIGKVGVKAEHVARGVLREARSFLGESVAVGQYLADQLMLPMGIAASQGQSSSFVTGKLSQHSQTHIDVLKKFLDITIDVTHDGQRNCIRFLPALS